MGENRTDVFFKDRADGIGFMRFEPADVVRHPLVQSIIQAYDSAKNAGRAARKDRDDSTEGDG